MQIKGIIRCISKRKVILETLEDIDIKEIKGQQRSNGRIYGVFETYDKDTITEQQRKQYFALVGDFSRYTGYPMDAADAFIRVKFMEEYGLEDYPSLRRNQITMDVASNLINYVLEYFIDNEIPFRYQEFYLTADVSRFLFALTMKRLCWICGQPESDIHHVDAIGMGRNRNKIDHEKHHYMCLCRKHHTEAHTMSLNEFCEKYHIKPIKLNRNNLISLGLMKEEDEKEAKWQDPSNEG